MNEIRYIKPDETITFLNDEKLINYCKNDVNACEDFANILSEVDEMKKFTINDIKEFDIVTFRSGHKSLVIYDGHNNLRVLSTDGYNILLSAYKKDTLKWSGNATDEDEDDIMEVRRAAFHIHKDRRRWDDYPVIWKREEEVKEMTVDEISEALGYKVKVIGEGDSK